MTAPDSKVVVVAAAPPVLVRESGGGEGSTSTAVAPPVFVISTVTGNACPRSMDGGADTLVTRSDARACTPMLLESTATADVAEPEFASAPKAPA
jgi:hypothetical protein